MSNPEAFRNEVKKWLETHCPASMRTPYQSEADVCWGGRNWTFKSEDQRHWLERMAEKGWTAPTWPVEYGGAGLTSTQNKILKEELNAINARSPLDSFGIWMLGPALLKYGSEALKRQHLPKIARGEIRWSQGYSEPNSGSDLASLATRCDDMGDHYQVNGSKIWTSYGDKADWIFCLVRTDFESRKHDGISFVLIDMDQPGATARPIKLISGGSIFTETFFENARVGKDQVVGEVNRGWTVAKYLLTHEREMVGDMGLVRTGEATLSEIAARSVGLRDGRLANSGLRSDVAQWEIDQACMALTIRRSQDEVKAGQSLGAKSSMFKYYGTELNKRRTELMMAIGGNEALDWNSGGRSGRGTARSWLRSKGNSIEGGTTEIQLNILSKRVLGLPG